MSLWYTLILLGLGLLANRLIDDRQGIWTVAAYTWLVFEIFLLRVIIWPDRPKPSTGWVLLVCVASTIVIPPVAILLSPS